MIKTLSSTHVLRETHVILQEVFISNESFTNEEAISFGHSLLSHWVCRVKAGGREMQLEEEIQKQSEDINDAKLKQHQWVLGDVSVKIPP